MRLFGNEIKNLVGQLTVTAPPAGGVAFSALGAASQYAGLFTGSGTAGTQKGLSAVTTTANAADVIFNVNNSSSNLMFVYGDGHGVLGYNGTTNTISWSAGGAVTIATPTSGIGLTVNGVSGNASLLVNGVAGAAAFVIDAATTSGQSQGMLLRGGTTAADYCVQFQNATAATTFMEIFGDGGVTVGNPTGGDQGYGTINATGLYVNGVAVSGSGGVTVVSSGSTASATGLAVGQTIYAVKPSTTARSSNTTLTADPALAFSNVPVGTYAVNGSIGVNCATTNTQAFQTSWSGTNAAAQGNEILGPPSVPGTPSTGALSGTNTQFVAASFAAGTNQYMSCEGTLAVTSSAGTFSLNWAQTTSNANSTSVVSGSWVSLTRLT